LVAALVGVGVWGEFADFGDVEDGALAALGGFDDDEFAAGRDVFVDERFELCRGALDFDGFYFLVVDGDFGIEVDGPAGGFGTDGHGAGEFSGDGEGFGGFAVGGLRECGDGCEEQEEW